jgi:Flp pilus assembly protein TadG
MMHCRLSRRDRGSVTIWLALASFVMIVLVGVAVDLSGQVYAQQHARDIAAQAARTAGQQIDAAQGVRGIAAQTNTTQAIAAAKAYIAAAGLSGEATVTGGGATITVTVADTYETKFLSIIGLQSMRVTGTAETRVVRVVGGVER